MKMKISLHPLHLDKTLLVPILLLVLLDQMIKRIIFHFFFTADVDLIGSFLRFYPVVNTYLSWPGNFLRIFQNFYFLIILNILSLILYKYLFCFYQEKKKTIHKSIAWLYIFFQSGAIASLLDKLLWGGSLDYIMFNEAFIFDLKDCYLTGSIIVGIVLTIVNYKELRRIKRKEFFQFIAHRENVE